MKLKNLFLTSICALLLSSVVKGQTIYGMDAYNGSTITTCQGQLWDSQNWDSFWGDCLGSDEYCTNEDYVVTINTGDPALVVRLNFLFYNIETGFDGLTFYDGATTGAPVISTLDGFGATGLTTAQSAFVVTSTQQYLTVRFTSDAVQNFQNSSYFGGFQALIGCEMQDCGPQTPAADDECGTATVMCDLDGYCGSTSGWYTAGAESASLGNNYGGPFCGSIENNSWIEFTAGATSASFTIESSGCDDPNSGIQAMIFDSDCSTFNAVSNCVNQSTAPGSDILSANGLTVGNTYYIMIDGFAGNACDYTITANTGVQVVDITSSAGANVCPGQCTDLTVNATGATSYNWTSSPAGASGSTATINVCPTVTTTYTAEVTGICGGTQTVSYTVEAVSPNVDFHALDGSFNSIPMPATVECDDPAFYLEANDSATAGGYITPALHFIFTSDGWATSDPSSVNIYSGGPPGSGTLIYSQNPLDNNSVLTVYGEYLSPSTGYYIEICDGFGDGGVDYEVVDGNTNVTYGSGSITSGNPCEVFGPFSPAGLSNWSSTAPAASWNADDAGLLQFDPSVAGVGTYDFTYDWDNTLGCSGSATHSIQVVDSQNPTITCPGDINTTADAGLCTASPALGSPVTADNCEVASVTNDAPASFPVGSTNVVWTVTDGGGNIATCTQVVTVTDNEDPIISCPSNIAVNNDAGNCSAVVNYTAPVGTDNCPGATTTQTAGLASGSAFPVGITTNTFVVTDAAGNTATCSFTVTVNDTQDPVISCPSNITVNNDAGNCSAVVNYTTPVGTDNCPGATTTQTAGLASGSAFPVGTTTNTFVVTDAVGNTATCSFDVIVNDTENPLISCPSDITVNNDAGNCSAVVNYTAPVGTDNCPGATTTQTAGLASGSTFPVGTTTNTFVVTDAVGNTATCSFDVIVNDTEVPVISCPANITVNNDVGNCSAVVNYTAPVGTDNCPGATTTQTAGLASGSAFPIGTTTNTFVVTDAAGNTATCSFDVVVNDTENPLISCPSDITVNNDAGNCSAVVNYTAPVGTDNCPGATTTQVAGLASGSTFPVGTTTNTFEVTDAVGNTATCSFDVIVNDTEVPVISCPSDITVNNDAGNCSAVVNYTAPVGTDNCPGATTTQTAGLASGSAFPVGITTNTFVVTDAAGNTATCSFDVIVNDTENPLISCPSDITVNNDAGNCSAVVNYTAPVGTDNCPGATTTQTAGLASGSTFPVGTTTNTFVVTDAVGNTATCSFDVIVNDTEDPIISCPSNITVNNDAGNCSAAVNYTAPVGTDNCPGASTTQTAGLASGSTFPVGTTTNTFVVTDAAGNTATCSFDVIVNDTEGPAISCPSDITVNNDVGNCSAVVNYTTPVGTDICPGATTTQTAGLASGSAFPVGTTTNTFVVTDAAGNTATCSFDVVVNDTEDPVITCPADITQGNDLGNCSAVVTYNVTTSDNCSGETITQTAGLASGDAFPVGTTTNTFVVTDAAGNTATCSFDVIVNDIENTAPTILGDTEYCAGSTAAISTQSYTDYSWSNGATTQNTNVTDADNPITVTVTFANGCVGTSAPYSVTENPNPEISISSTDPTVCDGTDGYITVSSVSGSTSGDLSWTGTAAGSDNAIGLPHDITGLSAGNYNVTFTDVNGCISNTASTVLNNPGAPTIDLINDTSSCEIDYVVPDPTTYITGTNLTGNQSFYSATGGNAADEITQGTVITSAMSPMTLYVYDNSGTCSSEISFVVEVNENPVATISPVPAEVCEGSSLTLDGNPTGGSGTYSVHDWTGDVSILNITNTQSPSTLTTATYGTYNLTYTVTDDKGCSGSDNITVEINEMPVLSGDQEICEDETTTISSTGTPDASTPWSSSDPSIATVDGSGNVLGVSGGTVDITFLDANGCSETIAIDVNAKPVITLTPSDPTTCNGTDGYITVNGAGTGTVDWSGDATGTDGSATLPYDITNLAAGNFDVTFTDLLTGCVSDAQSTSLINPGAPVLDAINDTSSCEVDFVIPDPSTYITGTNLTGNQAFYSATGGNAADELTQGTVITSTMSPMTIYAFDNNGVCESEISFTVYVNENPTVSISPNPASVCTDEDLQVDGNPSGGSGNYVSHSWTNTGSVYFDDPTLQNPTFNSNTAGSYEWTYTVEDDNGCVGTETITVTVLQSTVIDTILPISACGELTLPTITGSNLSGSEAIYDNTQANNGQIVTGPITSSGTFYAYDSGASCSNEMMFDVTINEVPQITSPLEDVEYCDYEVPQDVTITVTGQADWTVEYTVDGVSQTATSSQNTINLGNTPGIYNITVIEDNVCSDTINEFFEIIMKPSPPSPVVYENAQYCAHDEKDSMRAEGSGGTITWYMNQFQQMMGIGDQAMPENVIGTTVYYITETVNGCESEPSEISINILECGITLPTAITPDGDGLNDTWEIPNLDAAYPTNIVRVYNRWGSLIFEHDSSAKGPYNLNPWDGTTNGEVLPVGSYYYVIDLNNEEKETKTGAISIILD